MLLFSYEHILKSYWLYCTCHGVYAYSGVFYFVFNMVGKLQIWALKVAQFHHFYN